MLALALLLVVAPVRISIDAGEDTARLVEMIAAELPDATITSSAAAELHVRVLRGGGEYKIDVTGPEGQLGQRSVSEAEGAEPALRIAVLLTVRAVDAMRALDEPLEIPPPPSALSIYAEAQVLTAWWSSPSTPTLGFGVAGGVDLRTVQVGLLIAELGAPCCDRSVSHLDVDDAVEVLILADASFSPVHWGRFWLHVRGSAGIDRVKARVRGRIDVNPETAATQRAIAIEGVVRGGLSADMEVVQDRAWFGLGAGAWWRIAPLRLKRNLNDDELFTGNISPWVEARFRVNFL